MTENALNHRFRRLKTQTLIIRKAREQGFDIKDMTCNEAILPIAQDRVDIESTPLSYHSISPTSHVIYSLELSC